MSRGKFCVLVELSRKMCLTLHACTLRLIRRGGVSGPQEYQKFIMFLAQDSVMKSRNAGKSAEAGEAEERFAVGEMRAFIEECLDAKEHDEETEFYRSFTEKVKSLSDGIVEGTHDCITFVRLFIKNRILPVEAGEESTPAVLFGSAKVEPVSNELPPQRTRKLQSIAGFSRFSNSRRGNMGGIQDTFKTADSISDAPSNGTLGAIAECTGENSAEDHGVASTKSLLGEAKIADEENGSKKRDSFRMAAPVKAAPPLISPSTSPSHPAGKTDAHSKQRTLSFDSESSDEAHNHNEPVKMDASRLSGINLLTQSSGNGSPVFNSRFTLRGSPGSGRINKPVSDPRILRASSSDEDSSPVAFRNVDQAPPQSNGTIVQPFVAPSFRSSLSQLSSVSQKSQISVGSGAEKVVVERRASHVNADTVAFVCNTQDVLQSGARPGRRRSVMGSATVAVHTQHDNSDANGNTSAESLVKNHSIVEAYLAYKRGSVSGPSAGSVPKGKIAPDEAADDVVKEDFSDLFFFKDPKHFYRGVEVAIMLNCLYMSFWSTSYMALVNEYSVHPVFYQFLM
jgi:hypothetical protein